MTMESFLTRKDFKTMIPVPVKSEQHKYTIGGVPVSFPCKPYPTQIQMMSKVHIRVSKWGGEGKGSVQADLVQANQL